MPGSSFGNIFKVVTFGESHGPAIGAVVEGCPAKLPLSEADLQVELDRRRPGQSDIVTPRKESDTVEILSGVFEGQSTGAPIGLLIRNSNQKSKDYSAIKDVYRPGHADFTFEKKYGVRDYRGGGRSSGRETACRVAAGAIAKKILKSLGVSITSYTKSVANIEGEATDLSFIEKNIIRAADPKMADAMIAVVEAAKNEGDSVGGVIETVIHGCPVGLGEPVFDKLDALISHAVMSIGTIKGIEFGDGFAATRLKGSENNDAFVPKGDGVTTQTNHAGGLLGGISSGQDIVFRAAIKPPSSISKSQDTVNKNNEAEVIEVHGRHDPCICPRVVPVIEAMTALVLVDCYFQQKSVQIS